MTVLRGVTQSRWDYVNVREFGALTVALVGRSRAIILLPVGGREGINQHGELAVVEQAQRAEQPTADRDRFSFNPCGGASASLWQACPDTVLQRRVAMKVAFLGGLSVPEGQVPLSLSTLASVLPVGHGTIGTDSGSIGPKSRLHRPTFPHFPQFPRFPHLIFSTVHVCSVPPPVRNNRNKWNRNIGQNRRLVLFRSVE